MIRFAFILLLLFIVKHSFAQSETEPHNIKHVKNGFEIQYPENWKIDTSKIMGTELIIFSPLENDSDKFSENVNIIIQDLKGQDIDLEKYKQITDTQLDELLTDCKVFESFIIKTENKEYYRTTYSMTQGKLKLKNTAICFIKNGKAYLATFSSENNKYDQFKNTSDFILNSFDLVK